MKARLTQANLFKITPDRADTFVWDTGFDNLALRIREAGSRKFYVQQGKKRIVIGSAKQMTLAEARKRARVRLGQLADGQDPAAEKAKAKAEAQDAVTFGEVAEAFISHQSARVSETDKKKITAAHLYGTQMYLRKHCRTLHSLRLKDITRKDISELLKEISKDRPTSADRCLAAISTMFAWAISEDHTDANPTTGIKPNGTVSRERVLSEEEIVKIWQALPDGDYGRIVKLLFYTGCRRNEIGEMKWSEVSDREINLPASRSKNKLPFIVPLSDAAHEELMRQPQDRDYVFGRDANPYQGWSKAKAALDTKLDIDPWQLRDIRRTVATRMAEKCRVPPHIIEACLNHTSGAKRGVAGTYNRAVYADEKKGALESWADYLQEILGEKVQRRSAWDKKLLKLRNFNLENAPV
jgi:integrase